MEVVNAGVNIILFLVTNLVCVPKKRNLSIFQGLEEAWKHIRTLELKWKTCFILFRSGKSYGNHVLLLKSVVNPISGRSS